MAIGAALYVARRQQRIKEQELRLSLLSERRKLIRQMRLLPTRMIGLSSLDDPVVTELYDAVRDIRLLFDDATVSSVERIFDDAWTAVAKRIEMAAYREAGQPDKVQAAMDQYHTQLGLVLTRLPEAVKLIEAKARVPEQV